MFYVDVHAARYIIDDWFEIDEIENYYVAFFSDWNILNVSLVIYIITRMEKDILKISQLILI